MAHELIGLDDKREGLGQADGNGDVNSRTARRDVSDRTVDAAAAAKRDRAVFEHSVSGRRPVLDHRFRFRIPVHSPLKLAKRNYRHLNRMFGEFEPGLRFCLPQRSGWHRDNLIKPLKSGLRAVSFL